MYICYFYVIVKHLLLYKAAELTTKTFMCWAVYLNTICHLTDPPLPIKFIK